MIEAELFQTVIVGVLINPPSETGDAGFDDNAREFADKGADKRMAQRSLKSMAQARAEMILRVEGVRLSHITSKDPTHERRTGSISAVVPTYMNAPAIVDMNTGGGILIVHSTEYMRTNAKN
jgi:hypothetical protein